MPLLEVAVDAVAGSETVEEQKPLTRSKDLQIMAMESLHDDGHQKTLVDKLEVAVYDGAGSEAVEEQNPVTMSEDLKITAVESLKTLVEEQKPVTMSQDLKTTAVECLDDDGHQKTEQKPVTMSEDLKITAVEPMDDDGHQKTLVEEQKPVTMSEDLKITAVESLDDDGHQKTLVEEQKPVTMFEDLKTTAVECLDDDGHQKTLLEEQKPLTMSEDLKMMAVESMDDDGHQKTLVDHVESSLVLAGAEHAVDSAAGGLKIPVTVSDAAEGRAVLPVELKDAVTDVTVATETEVDAVIAVLAADVMKEEQDTGIEDFPVLGSEVIRVPTEVGQDRRCAEVNVIEDSKKVGVMELEPSKDLEMRCLKLGGDEPVVALRTEENKDKIEDKGVTLVDTKAIEESKMEIDGGEDEESFGNLHSLEVVADDKENVIEDSEKVEVMELEPSKDLEMRGLELGCDQQVVALKTEEQKDKMEDEGMTMMVDTKAIKESKMEIDGGEDEESFGKLHSLEVLADDKEDKEIVTGEETALADTELVTETDVGDSVKANDTDKEDEEIVTGEETGLADTDLVIETDVGDSVKATDTDKEDEMIVSGEVTGLADTELVTETDVGDSVKANDTDMETETYAGESGKAAGGKRKKGKSPKAPGNSKLASRAQKTTDEDVCFICFDGGDLFICDRRGCGKAYHPSCVDRDEAFFRAKGRWNCGWHLCSKCAKNAHYMCYTCTFSLCKACIKDAVILCVRGNKGFCETCMRTVMLIENHDRSHGDAEIDFDDKSSWEFLFKDYYTDLKSKLDLSFAEISEAKNPWKGSDAVPVKNDSPEATVGANSNEGSASDNHAESPEASKPKRRKDKKRLKTPAKERVSSSAAASVPDDGESISGPGITEWASKELIEFVMHMKDGDRSPLSQFDVQALLLEYIKRNKLRDPRRKSQIICDARLENLFGKPHVGHFEMLKLLESHFHVKDDSQTDDVQGSVVDTEVNHSEANENAETPTKGIKDKKRKLPKRGMGRGPQYSRYEFAAIDMHNIGLIYLRRKLMEDLLEDTDEFSNKVVGTFVRIRISGSMQKQDLYRLVLVVGTSKAAEPYKMGKRTTDTMLEILNLNKTEIVSIDSISNQDFTEEECKRLRQSIKCGLLNRMTVGDILDKAMELQEARVSDWLESEIMRLCHLRDRASDLGRKKQLRECVEKLQILKTHEERLRRLEEVPQIHADPNMDPNHESEEEDSDHEDSRQVFMKTKNSGFTKRGGVAMSSGTDFSSRDSWNGGRFSSNYRDVDPPFSNKNSAQGEDVFQSIDKDTSRNQRRDNEAQDDHLLKLSSPSKPETVGWSSLPATRSDKLVTVGSADSPLSVSAKQGVSAVGSGTPTPASEVTAVKVNETQKMWQYKDPSGKVQGPFSMVQLRKWSNTGYFPADLRIWKATDKQDNSILLTDALAGRFPEESPSGASAISTIRSLHVLSDPSGKSAVTPYQLAREAHLVEKLNIDQNHSALILQSGSSMVKHSMASPVEDPRHSAEKRIGSDLSHLPSPTPNRGNVGRRGEEEIALAATSYPIIAQSPAATLVEHASLSLRPTSTHNSAEQLIRGPETDSRNSSGGFAQAPPGEQSVMVTLNALQDSLYSSTGKLDATEKHGGMPLTAASTNLPIQQVNTQNSHVGTRWVGPSSNLPDPMPVTPQSYDQRGTITSTVQNPNGSFSNSGLALPQSEYWRPPPMQVDQSNVQPVPNLSWGSGVVEPPSPAATALRPGNPNIGWGPMQGGPNAGWVGTPTVATNMNWGAVVQGPGGNANPGWVMANMNLGGTVQGPSMGSLNPGWFGPPGNLSVQGLVPAVVNSAWVPPPVNMAPPAQAHVPGNGWAMPTGNPGAPTQGNSTNQSRGGLHQSGDKYSGEMDQGFQGGDSRFGGGYGSNRQSSFGRGGHGGSSKRKHIMCPYNNHGRCRKGATCDYKHMPN